jgi:hypothetical protein
MTIDSNAYLVDEIVDSAISFGVDAFESAAPGTEHDSALVWATLDALNDDAFRSLPCGRVINTLRNVDSAHVATPL